MIALLRRVIPLALICVLSFAGHSPAALPPPPLSTHMQQAIETDAENELRTFGGHQSIPGVFIALYMPGNAPFIKSVGYANLPGRRPFALPDRFRIGSNTKTFVVTVLLQLVDEHRLTLDDPVSKFDLGVRIPNGQHITVRGLCEMRSGLFEAYNTPQVNKMNITPQTHMDPRQMVSWAVQQKPLFAPDARYNYSNTNYLILGLIIESLTHDTIGHQIQKRLLVPLSLNATTFPLDDPQMPEPYSHGYQLNKTGAWQDVTVNIPPTLAWAAGAMISDVPDMKHWVKSYVLGTMNSKASQAQRLRCIPTGQKGLGFGLGIGCSGGWYGYTGGLPGYNTAAYYYPPKDITLIAFVNAQVEKPDPGVANAIVRDISRIITPGHILFP